MKKILTIAAVICFAVACNEPNNTHGTAADSANLSTDSNRVTPDSIKMMQDTSTMKKDSSRMK